VEFKAEDWEIAYKSCTILDEFRITILVSNRDHDSSMVLNRLLNKITWHLSLMFIKSE